MRNSLWFSSLVSSSDCVQAFYKYSMKEFYVLHVRVKLSFVSGKTVSGVGEDAKTWTPFNVGPGSTGTFSKRGTTIRRRRSSNCNEMTQKKVDKKQGHSQSECSGFYPKEPKEQMSVYHTTTAATKHPISPAVGTLAQVNRCFGPFLSPLHRCMVKCFNM